ncbi:MAG: photosynthetic complex assembly protein PuhC [Leptothrix sp. (in: b-proteobacteria)]
MSAVTRLERETAYRTGNFPRHVLLAVAAVLAATVLAVGAVRLSGVSIRQPDAATVHSRLLRFDDGPNGSVAVFDAASGAQIESVQGEQGFLRGALRALARERRARELGPQAPFELAAHADGRLSLTDTATGVRLDLESFGPTNASVFARWLQQGGARHGVALN